MGLGLFYLHGEKTKLSVAVQKTFLHIYSYKDWKIVILLDSVLSFNTAQNESEIQLNKTLLT
jgi:hypothetical protein